ncbi:MAG: DDE-type integrase/transposase/recombinase [Bdellovibrionales bacterium]|nr:DDE-type integrase/transposase/recombinase [Bdellovibrionales bacterium]
MTCEYENQPQELVEFSGSAALTNLDQFFSSKVYRRKAAKAFLKKAIKGSGSPKAINVDQSKSNIGAIQQMNKFERPKSNPIKLTKDKYRNNLVEQDHRKIKRKLKISLNFQSLKSAKAIIAGVEIVHMIFKGQSGCLPLINSTPESQFWGLVTI